MFLSQFDSLRGSYFICTRTRWLIDVGKDSEGMRVIADLHGGDPEDREAKAEFQEIKDKVMADVRSSTRCWKVKTKGSAVATFW